MKTTIAAVIALFFAVIGLGWIAAPDTMAGLFSLTLHGVDGRSAARADLGGLFVGMATLVGLGARAPQRWLPPAAVVLAVIAGARMWGVVVDGITMFAGLALGVELVGVGILVWCAQGDLPES